MNNDHDHTVSSCNKFKIPWGRPSVIAPLTEEDVENLKTRLIEGSKDSNVISGNFSESEIVWIKENVADHHMIRVMTETSDETVWVVIAKDEETAVNYYNRI